MLMSIGTTRCGVCTKKMEFYWQPFWSAAGRSGWGRKSGKRGEWRALDTHVQETEEMMHLNLMQLSYTAQSLGCLLNTVDVLAGVWPLSCSFDLLQGIHSSFNLKNSIRTQQCCAKLFILQDLGFGPVTFFILLEFAGKKWENTVPFLVETTSCECHRETFWGSKLKDFFLFWIQTWQALWRRSLTASPRLQKEEVQRVQTKFLTNKTSPLPPDHVCIKSGRGG